MSGDAQVDVAKRLRALADRIEAEERPVQGYGAVVIYGDGSTGCEYAAASHAELLGAFTRLEHRIVREEDG